MTLEGVDDAVDYIAELRQADDLATLPVGRRVVVIGGGMTAIDVAVQAKRLGAEDVTMVYRRGPEQMGASQFEQDLAQTDGVKIKYNAQPTRLIEANGHVTGVEFEYTAERDGRLAGTGETFAIDADMVFKAIGQTFAPEALNGAAETIELRGRAHQGRRRAAHLASRRLGRRRLRRRRRGSHRRRRRGRQAAPPSRSTARCIVGGDAERA